MQNIKKDLDRIMQTGQYTFQPGDTSGSMIVTTLHFETASTGLSPDIDGPHTFQIEWKSEQISNFITQLGFHNKDQDMEHQIEHFLFINEV